MNASLLIYPHNQAPSSTAFTWTFIHTIEASFDRFSESLLIDWPCYNSLDAATRSKLVTWGLVIPCDFDFFKHQQALEAALPLCSVIAIRFDSFKQGQGFSLAALLRERCLWQGPLMSTGDVLIDQLSQMARVGFDQFHLRDDQNTQQALLQFSLFNTQMQNDWRSPRSLIRSTS